MIVRSRTLVTYMETKPTLSIITPVYNGEKYISGCIEAVAAQNCVGIEHIVVDGASADGTVQILGQMAATHPHLRWISERDRGQSDAMNKGIDMARAAYIGILNVDDFYEPDTLSNVLDIIKTLSEPRFIVGACNIRTDEDKIDFVNRPNLLKFENIIVDDDMWPFPHNPSAYFYPKLVHEIVGPYNVEEHFGMDFEFILAVIQTIEPLYIDSVLGNFRRIPGTKTHNSIRDGMDRKIRLKIRIAAWKRAPLKSKMRIALLWMSHSPKRAYWNYRRHRLLRTSIL
jgi:glycosyltransferase involved in cell wall biosynthesis